MNPLGKMDYFNDEDNFVDVESYYELCAEMEELEALRASLKELE